MRSISWLLVGALLVSCSHSGRKEIVGDNLEFSFPATEVDAEPLEKVAPLDPEKELSDSEIPYDENRKVEKWLNYFQGRGKKHMRRYLERSKRYEALMKGILKEHGIPEDVFYVSMIESGFASSIRSHAGAVGYWQFISATGRRYGLKINSLVDERRDPILATEAAVRYFKSLYNLFGSWYLAFAAYNGGENRVVRILMKYHTRDWWALSKKGVFPRETVNYIPKFLAARMIAKNPEKYGFINLNYADPISFKEVITNKSVKLKTFAKHLNISYGELRKLNPQFLSSYAPVYKGKAIKIKVPVSAYNQASLALQKSEVQNQKFISKLHERGYQRYRIRRGDNLYKIARRFNTRISTLRRINGLRRGSVIRAGRYLTVPVHGAALRRVAVTNDVSISARLPGKGGRTARGSRVHRVRRGENLTVIARRYGVSLSSLLRANSLRKSSRLLIGKRLVIPGRGPSSAGNTNEKKVYVVRRGDNLTKIARRYGVTLANLLDTNNLRRTSVLMVGKKILIP